MESRWSWASMAAGPGTGAAERRGAGGGAGAIRLPWLWRSARNMGRYHAPGAAGGGPRMSLTTRLARLEDALPPADAHLCLPCRERREPGTLRRILGEANALNRASLPDTRTD